MKTRTGCRWLPLCVLMFTCFIRASAECTTGKDKPRQRKCSDGSCVDWLRGRCPGKCALLEKKCNDGTCVRHLSYCRRSCYAFKKTKPQRSSVGVRCVLPNVTCPDGLCIHISQKHCCDVKCQHYSRECPDGSCMGKEDSRCPDEPCPANKPIACKGTMKCITKSQKCNGKYDCPDGHDEEGCDSSPEHWAISAIALVISSVSAVIVWCCTRKGSGDRICDEEMASRPTPQEPGADDPPAYEIVMSSDQYTMPLKDQIV